MRILLGVTGGIAAYKVALVLRQLREDGHAVRVIPTQASLNFVGRATWEALSGEPAPSDTFDSVPSVQHVRLGQSADIVLVAPATADFLASMVHGQAKDLLGNTLLVTRAPVVVAPAMHTEMWEHAATRHNVAALRDRGVHVIEPASGRLTGTDSGPGRLPEPQELVESLYAVARGEGLSIEASRQSPQAPRGDLEGLRVLISAGGTREPIDSVRFLGNRSSGHQGFALAEAARERGAVVSVVAANVALPLGESIGRVDVETTSQMADAVRSLASDADVVIMAAAVADFRPEHVSEVKLKKNDGEAMRLDLVPTEDILAGLVRDRIHGQTIVGFAAETGDQHGTVLEHGAAKARRKGADLLIVNEVGERKGFGPVDNNVTVLDSAGSVIATAGGYKLAVAHEILSQVAALRSQ